MGAKGYTLPVLGSVLLHGMLVTLIVFGWVPADESRKVIKPRYIQAELLQLQPAVVQPAPEPKPQAQPKPQPKVDDKAAQRAEQERREQVRKEQERQARVKAEAEAKRKAEEARKEEARKAEQARREAQRREQEEKARQEAARRAREADAARAAAEAAENEQLVGSYDDYIIGLIAANWSRPPSATRDMEVELEILLGSAGRVTGVRVVKSSGNPAFDRSAEQAVLKVSQFSRLRELQDSNPMVYQQEFRRKLVRFRPEDLRK